MLGVCGSSREVETLDVSFVLPRAPLVPAAADYMQCQPAVDLYRWLIALQNAAQPTKSPAKCFGCR